MTNLQKFRRRLQSIGTALDNHEHGRMPLDYLENVFEENIEAMRNLIHAQYRAEKEGK